MEGNSFLVPPGTTQAAFNNRLVAMLQAELPSLINKALLEQWKRDQLPDALASFDFDWGDRERLFVIVMTERGRSHRIPLALYPQGHIQ